MDENKNRRPVVLWGTYDTGKPRVRILRSACKLIDTHLVECHYNPWAMIEDKTQLSGIRSRAKIFLGLMFHYPILVVGYLRMPKHDVVLVPYMGNLDVLVLWPFAKIRGAKICWDVFISLYDTAVIDRKLFEKGSIFARLLFASEWLATRAADIMLVDSNQHANYISDLYHFARSKIAVVWVGVESGVFSRTIDIAAPPSSGKTVLFYGQFIPLHGLSVLIDAIHKIERSGRRDICFNIIGRGQEASMIDNKISELGLRSIRRTKWVDYQKLPECIAAAEICLGIFAQDGKALRVIPNKIYQILAMGGPLITMDSPAIREVVIDGPGVRLVNPGDADDLANKILELIDALGDSDRRKVELAGSLKQPIVDQHIVRKQLCMALNING